MDLTAVTERQFYCTTHDKQFPGNRAFNIHMNSRKHIARPTKNYFCEHCNYRPTHATNYFRHLKTKKHRRNSN
jgi:hypothetical protein